ncbi:MAG: N-6 DNA methylase [Phycisphaerales bacterium]|nr:MAG: N-6 DNA methylase [Phycisphaerales bacterium]
MQGKGLLKKLGYDESPNFLRGKNLARAPDYGHIFRRAKDKPCGLQGVYALREPRAGSAQPIVPVVYVCRAASPSDTDEIHRLVWNQDVVPFVLVYTREEVRLYSGFRCQESSNDSKRGLLLLEAFNDIEKIIHGFCAEAIDSGRVWKEWGSEVTAKTRVEWELLDNLQRLDKWLQGDGGLRREASHALIGKYVYLHYLKDRGILEAWFDKWNIAEGEVFGRCAKRAKLERLIRRLDDWLNGAVFPIDFRAPGAPSQEHIEWVASVFAGDEVLDGGGRQLHFDFARYNFKYIPIETLSVIYEQFLHAPDTDAKPVKDGSKKISRGREAGAYYTPLPVVNLMLAEMEERLPLKKGMRILDPSCGSGAFLVQCYRRLIEKELPAGTNRRYALHELRKLLEDHIFGVDRDADACSVTELSLTLTLLDYIDPPDLNGDERRKLPSLRGRNIFCADFFDDETPWALDSKTLQNPKKRDFNWIVGNPPWSTLSPRKLSVLDRAAWNWMGVNKDATPVADNQIAQAFAWRVTEFLGSDGKVGLLLPAMTLFSKTRAFRKAFFAKIDVLAVVNFANLRHVLFRGRSSAPAASFFFSPRLVGLQREEHEESIPTYSPMLANQEPTLQVRESPRGQSWSLVVNASEIHGIATHAVVHGDALPWKTALWGSHLDLRLLVKTAKRFPSLGELDKDGTLTVSEGPQLREGLVRRGDERTAYCDEVVGKDYLDTRRLSGLRDIFNLPTNALTPNRKHYRRVRGGEKGLLVCRPPHVVVSASRAFVIYSDQYFIPVGRQIAIGGANSDAAFLKALSLFLNSDFVFYHQFFTSPEFGIGRDRAVLDAMKALPIPFDQLSAAFSRDWCNLHSRIVDLPIRRLADKADDQMRLSYSGADDVAAERENLIRELNTLTKEALKLDDREQALVDDFAHVRLELNDGKTGKPAVRPPEVKEMRAYAKRLRSELNAFIGRELLKSHSVRVIHDELSAMICVNLTRDANVARKIIVEHADNEGVRQLRKTRQRLRQEVSQWVYFDRNLRLYEGTRTYLFKPMQRFHWTESQAMCDAAEIIAETLAGPGGDS